MIKEFLSTIFQNKKRSLAVLLVLFLASFGVSLGAGGITESVLNGLGSVGASIIGLVIDILTHVMLWGAEVMGMFFDNTLAITLDPKLYNQDWVKLAWAYLRDLANVLMIVVIIYIGFKIILDGFGDKGDAKEYLLRLVIIAIIINFSLFFGRVIIQAGNFTGGVFYQMIDVQTSSQKTGKMVEEDSKTLTGNMVKNWFFIAESVLGQNTEDNPNQGKWEPPFGARTISTALIAYINPSYMMDDAYFKERLKGSYTPGQIKYIIFATKIVFIVFLWMYIKIMWTASLAVLARTFRLIGDLVSAPIRFIQYFMPSDEKKDKLKEWFVGISTRSFCITKFFIGLWMVFLIMTAFMQTAGSGETVDSFMMAIMTSGSKLLIIYVLFKELSEILTKDCDDGGELSAHIGNAIKTTAGAVGAVAGLAFGGAGAIVARNALAGAGNLGKRWTAHKHGFFNEKVYSIAEKLDQVKVGGKSYADITKEKMDKQAHKESYMTDEEIAETRFQQAGGEDTFKKLLNENDRAKEHWENYKDEQFKNNEDIQREIKKIEDEWNKKIEETKDEDQKRHLEKVKESYIETYKNKEAEKIKAKWFTKYGIGMQDDIVPGFWNTTLKLNNHHGMIFQNLQKAQEEARYNLQKDEINRERKIIDNREINIEKDYQKNRENIEDLIETIDDNFKDQNADSKTFNANLKNIFNQIGETLDATLDSIKSKYGDTELGKVIENGKLEINDTEYNNFKTLQNNKLLYEAELESATKKEDILEAKKKLRDIERQIKNHKITKIFSDAKKISSLELDERHKTEMKQVERDRKGLDKRSEKLDNDLEKIRENIVKGIPNEGFVKSENISTAFEIDRT